MFLLFIKTNIFIINQILFLYVVRTPKIFEDLECKTPYMPQIEFVGFHYTVNALSIGYLLAYILVLLFLIKPLFKESVLAQFYESTFVQDLAFVGNVHSEKVIFTQVRRRVPKLSTVKSIKGGMWGWLKYTPRIGHLLDDFNSKKP